MKRYTSCLVLAAWLCVSAKADDDTGYTPPQPLREAVTARSAATDINDTSLAGAPPDATTSSEEAKMNEINGAPVASADSMSGIDSSAAPAIPQIDEIAEKPMTPLPAMAQTNRRLFTDPITEMMGGEFNTESNQRMAESFLSVRPRVMHLKANRDF